MLKLGRYPPKKIQSSHLKELPWREKETLIYFWKICLLRYTEGQCFPFLNSNFYSSTYTSLLFVPNQRPCRNHLSFSCSLAIWQPLVKVSSNKILGNEDLKYHYTSVLSIFFFILNCLKSSFFNLFLVARSVWWEAGRNSNQRASFSAFYPLIPWCLP